VYRHLSSRQGYVVLGRACKWADRCNGFAKRGWVHVAIPACFDTARFEEHSQQVSILLTVRIRGRVQSAEELV
jgi:hypothetical protein